MTGSETGRALTAERLTQRASALSVLGAIGVVLIPKCPMCCLAYAGLLSGLGVASASVARWILPVTTVLLAANLIVLGVTAKSRKFYGPLMLAVTGTLLVLMGKLWLETALLAWTGVALIALSSGWNFVRKPCRISIDNA